MSFLNTQGEGTSAEMTYNVCYVSVKGSMKEQFCRTRGLLTRAGNILECTMGIRKIAEEEDRGNKTSARFC